MSNITKTLTSGGPIPPAIPTQFNTDSGNAVPSGNILIVEGKTSTENNTNGIITKGNTPATAASNEVDIVLTNRIVGSATTTDAATTTVLSTFNLGIIPGSYIFTTQVTAYNLTDSLAASYSFQTCYRTDGATTTRITSGNLFISEEGAMSDVVVTNTASGNSYQVTVNGLALKTIHYVSLTEYIFAS